MIIFVWTEIEICVCYRLRLQSSSCGWDLIKWVALYENCLAWQTSRHADLFLQWFLHFNIYTYYWSTRLKSNESQPTFNDCSGGRSGWWLLTPAWLPKEYYTGFFFAPDGHPSSYQSRSTVLNKEVLHLWIWLIKWGKITICGFGDYSNMQP